MKTKKPKPKRGVCKFCGCTEVKPCYFRVSNSEVRLCSWLNKAKTVCSAPLCVARYQASKSALAKLEDSLFAEFKTFQLPIPERQYIFHPKRKWHFDFAWPDHRIAVEINGGIYTGGRHSRGATMELDYEKLNEATKMGWSVFQFGPRSIKRKKNSQASSNALAFMHGVFNLVGESK